MIHNKTTLLEGMVLYHPMIEIWSGTVRVLRDQDLKEVSTRLPPADLVSDGRKRIVRKDPLRPLLAVRKRVDRMLHTVGFPFMGGIAVPEGSCVEIEAALPDLERTFNDTVDQLCSNLQAEYLIHREQYPDWADMLKDSELGEAAVRVRCRFDVVSHRVAAPDSNVSATAASRFNKIANAALPSLLDDIARDADEMYKNSFKGKGRVAAKTAAMVIRMVDKLKAFSFLDPRVAPMSEALGKPLCALPSSGHLSPSETAAVCTVLHTLRDPDRLIEQGSAAIRSTIDLTFDASDIQRDDLFIKQDASVVNQAVPAPILSPASLRSETPRYQSTF